MKGLGTAENSGQSLVSGANNIVVGLLGGERRTGCLCMETQHHRAWVAGVEAIAHNMGPDAPCRAKLSDFLEEVVMAIEKEGELTCEGIDVQPRVESGLHVTDGVREGEGDLLHGG